MSAALLSPAQNSVLVTGSIIARGELRYTPAGVAAVELTLAHASEQAEAEKPRRVECELECVALGQMALLLKDAQLGQTLRVSGFLAAKSVKRRTLRLHISQIQFLHC